MYIFQNYKLQTNNEMCFDAFIELRNMIVKNVRVVAK